MPPRADGYLWRESAEASKEKTVRINSLAFKSCLIGLAIASTAPAAPPSGAIFTTTFDGAIVNENHFASRCEVYLDGGPGPNAPAHAAGLDDGDYYFQVTDPSGKTLLSTDLVSNRRFQVQGGVIVAYTGVGAAPHPFGIDQDHPELGAITIRLANETCPADFLSSTNDGGIYKAWATPVEDFVGDPSLVDNDCGKGCYHGFRPKESKTDNFKADEGAPAPSTFCLTVRKMLVLFGGLEPAEGWQMTITDPTGAENLYFTDFLGELKVCDLPAGSYTVTEDDPPTSEIDALIVNGVELVPDITYSFTWDSSKAEPVIEFHNVEGGLGF